MILNRGRFTHYTSLDGQHYFDRFGLRTLLAWLSTRAVRGGPGLLVRATACLVVIVLLAQSLPRRASDVAFGRQTSQWWRWGSKSAPVAGMDDGSVAGGLRVVVFGTSDIATPTGDEGHEKSWTETMCGELGCTSYISLVPPPASRSLLSNGMYASGLEKVTKPKTPYKDGKKGHPGLDYSFFPELFPVPWDTPDFQHQVDDFLARPRPQRLPKETVWVFNFGQWDVWNLAAMPLDVSEPLIGTMVEDLFANVERLYEASMNQSSIAHSDYSQTEGTMLDLVQKPRPPMASVGDGAKAVQADENIETFRIIVPMIMDTTLVPGWHTERPELPTAHSKAEQLRHAAKLTDRWNDAVQSATNTWAKKMNPTDDVTDETEGDESSEFNGGKNNNDNASPATALPLKRRELSRRAARFTPDPAKPTSQPVPVQVTNGAKNAADGNYEENAADPVVYPLRDAIIYDLQEYITEVMVERQLRNSGIVDQNGLGGRPESQGYQEVSVPCVQTGANRILTASARKEAAAAAAADMRRRVEDGDGTDSPNTNTTEISGGQGGVSNSTDIRTICNEPSEHLFYTALTLSSRAIDGIGKETAELVMANMTLRGYWESLSQPNHYSMPTGFKKRDLTAGFWG